MKLERPSQRFQCLTGMCQPFRLVPQRVVVSVASYLGNEAGSELSNPAPRPESVISVHQRRLAVPKGFLTKPTANERQSAVMNLTMIGAFFDVGSTYGIARTQRSSMDFRRFPRIGDGQRSVPDSSASSGEEARVTALDTFLQGLQFDLGFRSIDE